MMRLPRGGRAGRGPADQDVDGAPPSSYQVMQGLDRRRCVAGRPGRGQITTRADPRGRQSNSGSHAPAGQALTFSTSKSVAKAPRTGIGREKKRGIPTIPSRRPDAIGAFATDLDNRRRQWPLAGGGRRLDGDHDEHPGGRTGSRERRPAASTSLDPRARTSSRRSRGLPGDLAGQVTCSAVTRRSRGLRRRLARPAPPGPCPARARLDLRLTHSATTSSPCPARARLDPRRPGER